MEKIKLGFEAYAFANDKWWFFAYDHNALYCKNSTNDEIEYVGMAPNEKTYAIRLFSKIEVVNDILVLIPFKAKNICLFDIKNTKFVSVELPSYSELYKCKLYNPNAKFWCSHRVGDKVVLLPHNYFSIIVLDVEHKKIEILQDLVKDLDAISMTNDVYISDSCFEKDKIWMSCGCADVYVEMDINTFSYSVVEVKHGVASFSGILKDENDLWLAPRKQGAILRYNLATKQVVRYEKYPHNFISNYVPFHTFLKYRDAVLAVGDLANQCVLLKYNSTKMQNISMISELIDRHWESYVFGSDRIMAFRLEGDIFTFVCGRNYKIYSVNLQDGKVREECLYACNDTVDRKNLIYGLSQDEDSLMLQERESFDLKEYLSLLV